MDAKPKSNKLKRRELQEKVRRKAERREVARLVARESKASRMTDAERALRAARAAGRNPDLLIDRALYGEAPETSVPVDLRAVVGLWHELTPERLAAVKARPDRSALRGLIAVCRERSGLFTAHGAGDYAKGLLALAAHCRHWVRTPGAWEPDTHNARRQFASLARHLVARYDIPTFLDTAWFAGLGDAPSRYQGWFVHVAQGQNLRTARDLPVPLTKKQAHYYMGAPSDFDVLSAFRYAQVLDLGGDERLARSVAATRAGADFAHDDFWLTVLRWLVAQPMLDPSHHGPVIDYLYHQRYVASVPNPGAHRDGAPLLVPPQPNLTMKGRNPETLLRAVNHWHHRLGRERAALGLCWGPSPFPPLQHMEGQGESLRVFTIEELTSSAALTEEGRAMGHCVGSYARSCHSGRVSIWSLRVIDAHGKPTRLLTLEVANNDRQVIQARRKFNEMPHPREWLLLRRWADSGGPTLSKWLVGQQH